MPEPGRGDGRADTWSLPSPVQAGWRGWLEWFNVLIICGLISGSLILSGGLRRADNIVHDALLSLHQHNPDDRILVVAIDNRSLEALGRWPWSRDVHARLLDRLTQQEVGAVGFDVLFTEASGPADAVLASAIARSGRTCLPMAVDPSGPNGAAWSELSPLPQLASTAAGIGQVNLTADEDGIVRRAPLSIQASGRSWDHLVTCMLRTAGLPVAMTAADKTPGKLPEQGQALGVTSTGITFPGRQGAFRTASYIDVLNGEVPPALLSDRLVLVGMTADGQGDRYAVAAPRSQLQAGVEIQAALLDTLLSGAEITTVSTPILILVALAFLIALMLAFLFLSPRWGLVTATGLILVVLILSTGLFALHIWLPPLGIITGLAIACPLWSWRRLATTSTYLDQELRRFVDDKTHTVPSRGWASDDLVSRQVTAMRSALTRLRGMNRFISDALESLPDATVVTDKGGRIIFANQKARTLFERDDLSSLDLAEQLSRLHPDLAVTGPDGIEVTLADDRALQLDTALLLDTEGEGEQRIVRLADISALRSAERQRKEALQLLGHDMRAPQTAILTLIEGDHDRADPRFLPRIADYARMTLRLADGYVQLARAEAGPLEREPLSLRDVVIDAMDILWPVSRSRQIRITLSDGPDIEVEGDRSLLTRAVMNLLDNGIRHSPPGTCVSVAAEVSEGVAQISIQDAGPGMSPAEFDQFLMPFRHSSERSTGVGLGLAFVARVAARHGGELRLADPVDKASTGARILLSLPGQ